MALFPGSGVLGCLSIERGLCTTVHCAGTLLHVVTKVVKWPVLSSSCCVTSLQWWPLIYDCDLNKLPGCFFYIIIAIGTETMAHQKTKQTFLKAPNSSAFLGHCVPLGSLSHTHESIAHVTLSHWECWQEHSHFLARPFPAWALLSSRRWQLQGLWMVHLSALMLSCACQERGLCDHWPWFSR